MKDRIRQIMESQHMSQQVFAQFIETSPATLSSIFTGRTNPTMNVVGAIKRKIPNINTDWLMFGTGTMYLNTREQSTAGSSPAPASNEQGLDPILDFDLSASSTPPVTVSASPKVNGVRNTRSEAVREEIKIVDKPQRRVIEIRVFYDDQTWDSFVPAKK